VPDAGAGVEAAGAGVVEAGAGADFPPHAPSTNNMQITKIDAINFFVFIFYLLFHIMRV
jgi:hypothetical protein